MTIPIILILAVLWAAFFAWPLVQRRLSGTRRDSIGDFSKRVSTIGRVGGHLPRRRPPAPTLVRGPVGFAAVPSLRSTGLPMSPGAQRRRRDALLVLGIAVLATLLLAVVSGNSIVWFAQVVVDVLFAAYVGVLVVLARRHHQHRAQVHQLPEPETPASRALVLHRTGSS